MRKVHVVLMLVLPLLQATHAEGQELSATYTYDANGCRVRVVVVYLQRNATPAPAADTLSIAGKPIGITVYPNPTAGSLRVVVPTGGGQAKGNNAPTLTVHNMQGVLVFHERQAGEETPIDLRGQPDGVYLLTVEIGDVTSAIKVVKRS